MPERKFDPKRQNRATPPQPEDYLAYVEALDITEEEKIEFLTALMGIMRSFVDLGFGINTIPDYIPALAEFSSKTSVNGVKLNLQSGTDNFDNATARKPGRKEEI